jgi:acetamidase/formamidase
MAKLHHLGPEEGGFVSRDLAPAPSIDSGDRVVFQTLDSGWGAVEQIRNFSEPRGFRPRDLSRDVAHALTGPVEIRGARPGMVLEIRLRRIQPGHWGWSAGSELPASRDQSKVIAERKFESTEHALPPSSTRLLEPAFSPCQH